MTDKIPDQVPSECPGSREIGFSVPERYNASRILFDNLAHGRGERLALTGPAGTRSTRNSAPRPADGDTASSRSALRVATAS
jgi:hypothetical protein